MIVVDHNRDKPGSHEVKAGGRLMAHCLNNAININGLRAKVATMAVEDPATLFMATAELWCSSASCSQPERLPNSEAAMKGITSPR